NALLRTARGRRKRRVADPWDMARGRVRNEGDPHRDPLSFSARGFSWSERRRLAHDDRASERRCAMNALVIPLLLVALAPQASEKKIALVVGSNRASEGRAALRYAKSDAEEMASVLKSVGGFRDSDVRVLVDPKPDEILGALDG